MLVRLLPYLEKNYSYIELGGYSTGKTNFAEKFSSSEKIASNITQAQLYYNVKEKRKGILFSKDVIYIDEANFSSFKEDEAKILLQVLAGNKVEVRDNYLEAENIEVSFVNQGNIENGVEEYKNKTIFNRFETAFNEGAFLDRTNFFIAGWLIPTFFKIKLEEDQEIIPLNVLEDFLKIQRKQESYIDLIENFEIKFITIENNQGRFIECIKTTISGFLKLLYPDKKMELEKLELEKIINLSILGKYAIHHIKNEDYNTRIEFSYKHSDRMSVDMSTLFKVYIESREHKYFKDEELQEEKFVVNKLLWQNDNSNFLNHQEIIRKNKMEKINKIPEAFENIFDRAQDSEIKNRLIECYKIIATYDVNDYIGKPFSEENECARKDFFYALFYTSIFFLMISSLSLLPNEKELIIQFINKVIDFKKKELFLWENQDGKIKLNSDLSLYLLWSYIHCGVEGQNLESIRIGIKNNLNRSYSNQHFFEATLSKENKEKLKINAAKNRVRVDVCKKTEIRLEFFKEELLEDKKKSLHEFFSEMKG